jgi:hypothetical protein
MVNDRRRPRVPARPKPALQLTGPIQLDDETRNALILFNARLVAQDELEREKRRVDKAAKAKDEAAAKVRQLENDPSATAEQRSAAQAGYLASLDALNRAKSGEPAPADTADEADETDSAESPSEAPDDLTATDEPVTEVAVAEEPAAEDTPAAEPEPVIEGEAAAEAAPLVEAPVAVAEEPLAEPAAEEPIAEEAAPEEPAAAE